MNKFYTVVAGFMCFFYAKNTLAQNYRWQQKADYTMSIEMNVENHQFKGTQKIVYTNNSPDTLTKVFYHLYYNAFQPMSIMDVRSRTIADPDRRVKDRIFKLKDNEIGYQKIIALSQDKQALSYKVEGTILEVTLAKPILPKAKITFDMQFEAQVPAQIRRTGRDNAEKVSYSMSQWYPKLCEYDEQGWHANPYIAREFYGNWGDFDVKITMDSAFVIGGTGYLQNPQEIGHGYLPKGQKLKRPNSPKLTWHFLAPNVHDFAWGADKEYVHTILRAEDVDLHYFYQPATPEIKANWEKLPAYTAKALAFLNKNFGKYPYKQYSFVQGGDGGMEYPMATLMNGNGAFESIAGTAVHELIHSWFQGVLATNESLYAWMDEGFNSFAGDEFDGGDHTATYDSYFNLVKSGKEEPLSTHADHFNTNYAYSVAAYSKGSVFLGQLRYIIGEENFKKGMLNYFNQWKFRHPNANDFVRVMEKTSGLELDWFKEYFVNSTHTIDYGIGNVYNENGKIFVQIDKIGRIPMPLDIEVKYKNGSKTTYYIPLDLMRGEKPQTETKRIIKPDWAWTFPSYLLEIEGNLEDVESICIDNSQKMADINRTNNFFTQKKTITTPSKNDVMFKEKY